MKAFLKSFKVPHVFTLLTLVIFFCALLTWLIPSGRYERETRTFGSLERTMVVPGTFETLPKHLSAMGVVFGEQKQGHASPVSFQGFLSAIPRGMIEAGDIIFFVFIIGGTFGILQRTGTISAGIHSILERFRDSWRLLTIVLMTVMAIGSSTLGMAEEFIPLIPIFLLVSKEIRCDRVFAVGVVFIAAQAGFAAATTNPFTVNIAQGIAELPLNSAMPFRLVFFVCSLTVAITYVLRYGARIRRDPSLSVMKDDDFELSESTGDAPEWNRTHLAILLACLGIFVFILFAVQSMGWWLPEMAGGFFLMGIVAMAIGRLPLDDGVRAAVRGMEEMVVAALVVGFARGVTVVMVDGQILDTLIYAAAAALQHVPRLVAAEGMLLFQAMLNFFIPSGSGQATVTMPLMAPLADVLGLTRQTAVFAFTCGDGFANLVIPTSGVLMAMLGLGKVPFEKWIRFVFPVFLQLMLVAAVFLAVSVLINLQ
jgi:uncharacterized ion transporter superfamily protein YfcC